MGRRREAERSSVPSRPSSAGGDPGALPPAGPPSGHPPGGTGWRDRLATVPLLGRAFQVHSRYGRVHGNEIAAAITLQGFLALFPLALVAVAVLGFLAAGAQGDIPRRIADVLGLRGEAADLVASAVETAERSRRAASVVGLAGLLWSGLGLVSALQFAYNEVWGIAGRGIRDKVFALVWLVGASLLFLGSVVVTTVLRFLPPALAPLGLLVSLSTGFAFFWWTSNVLPNRDVGWRPLVPGAVLGAVGLEVLKLLGAYVVPWAVTSASDLYGSLGVVFALLAWLLLVGRLIVYSAVLDVVLHERARGLPVADPAVRPERGGDHEVERPAPVGPEPDRAA